MNTHPCHVTYERLRKHYERYWDTFTPAELYHIEIVMDALDEIASGQRELHENSA